MTVVHICKVAGLAGAERHLLSLLPALATDGTGVAMIALEERARPAAEFCAVLASSGIRAETERIVHDVDPGLVGRRARRHEALEADIVHTQLIHADLYGHRAARRAGVRAVVSSRHDNNPFRRHWFIRALNARAMRDARQIIAISDAVARFVVEVEGSDPSRVRTIPYGVDVPVPTGGERLAARRALAVADDVTVVGVVGRLVAQKGIDVFLDALPAIRHHHPPARGVVIGDGPLMASLRERARRNGLDGAVIFAGWRPDARMLMHAMDVVTMPSRWEGLGLAALEAMAAGRPLVASAVDALPELVVDGETGVLVPAGDPSRLAGAVVALLDDCGRGAALGAAARQRVIEQFSIEKMTRATAAVYARALERAR